MKNLLRLSIKNLYRNKKRTFLTGFVIAMGIMFTITALSYFNGVSNIFLEEGTKVTGEIRITADDHELKEKTLDVSSNIDVSIVKKAIIGIDNIKVSTPRIKFGGLLYKDEEIEKNAIGFGIEKDEYNIWKMQECIFKGKFLNFNKDEILIGKNLAISLKLNIGDELTILTKTQYESVSALNYKVVGFFDVQNAFLNKGFFIPLKSAQYLLDMDNACTEYCVYTNNIIDILKTKKNIIYALSNKYEIKLYNEIGMASETSKILPFIETILVLIFSLLAGIGVVNTMLMVVFERIKEIGVFKALGMREYQISILFILESVIIGVLGSLVGIIFGGSFSYWLSIYGIKIGKVVERISKIMPIKSVIYPKLDPEILLIAFIVGVLTSFIAALIPVIAIVRKSPVECLND